MSTILQALKRVEAERETKPPRPLREEVVAALEAAETARLHRSRRGWRLLALGGAAAVVGFLAWLGLSGSAGALAGALRARLSHPAAATPANGMAGTAPAIAVRPPPSPAPPAAPAEVAAQPSPPRVDPAAEAPLGSPEAEAELPATPGAATDGVPLVAVVPRPPPAPALQADDSPSSVPAPPPPGSIPPAPKQTASQAALAARSPDASTSAREDDGVAAPSRPARAPAPAPRARPAARVQVANARDVDVLRTVWHPHPERRLALLLLPGQTVARELREGETADGWTVLSIEPSSVVLLHDGVELRAAVGSGRR